jgi:hypothetical protein
MTRKGLDIGSLDDFTPRRQERSQEDSQPVAQSGASGSDWNRREAPREGQFTIRAKLDTIARFKSLCRPRSGGRYTYGEMLEILMDKAGE